MEKVKKIVKDILCKIEEKRKYSSKYKVEGTIKGKKQMLYVLAGYKEELWDDVFGRIKKFQPQDLEVCVASSGKYCEKLSNICKKNDWVYLSTSLNHVCVLSNIVMRLYADAEYIYKLDEDIYIPENYFESLLNAYKEIEEKEATEIGYVCPMLPLGFYGMHDFLFKEGKLNDFEENFGKHRLGGVFVNPYLRAGNGVDEYIWKLIGVFDDKAKEYSAKEFTYEPCVTRSGIAAILFKRDFWDRLGGLKRSRGIGVGDYGDEGQITSFCALKFQICYCVHNLLVGHFAFGGSEENVLKLKEEHPEFFELKM